MQYVNLSNYYLPCIYLDSSETAAREINYFFPEFSTDNWFQNDMKAFQNGQVCFDKDEEIHKIKLKPPELSMTNKPK